ncbi:uncharacterized protein involved in propionate catabolism [Desulfosporosinus orientis DSM 765]|uniref:Uncharacterized protein involved in propionate catabolism n=1 Tax=Desulfosporosinus orientis (strain ATCC 19365 / DSM 765 / NCIMB 8382 / VKM B-1628 / Singapore I) TaxID=768706 RepID=G7WEY5_DESOD|nr:MmgE/PrpD family protein [Desulfosporosinus orientis]AET67314.1 uncharacterized protein involved in propionate catabolism [Desulfosporosinus orientis DSM 765]
MSLSLELACFIKGLRFADLPAEVVLAAKNAFLDWLGSAAAGSQREPGRIVLSVAEELGGKAEATLISTGRKTSSILAAFVNGSVSHIVELDDVHKASIIHAGAPIIPAALAAAEKTGAGGRALIEGIVAGYESAIRIGEAVTPAHYHYWHTTGTVGTFGAAAAAGKILNLSEKELVHALGTAGTQAAGLWEFLADGAMSKHLHPGKAALNGLLAALLAGHGFTGASKIIEGEKGFVRATAQEFDLSKISQGLGQNYKILENCIKIHASCRHTHPAIDLVLELVKKYDLTPENIQTIVTRTYPIALDLTGNYEPHTLYAAKFSLPFCVALAAKQRKAGLNDFNQQTLVDPVIRDLMSRVQLMEDPEITALYPAKWPALVEITDSEGKMFSQRTDYPAGDPENPVSQRDLEQKFRELASAHFGVARVQELVLLISQLEDLSSLSVLFAR